MKILEFGNINNPAIVLIHGMGMNGLDSFNSIKENLIDKFRIIIPLLDGYCDDESTYTSINDQANKISKFIKENYNGKVYAILGMSMGGFITLDIVYRNKINTDKIILDSGYMKNMKFPKLIASIVSKGFTKIINDKNNIIIRLGMKKIMGYCFKKEDLYTKASLETIYNSEYSCITYKLPTLDKTDSIDLTYLYGSKEKYMIKGMKYLKKFAPYMESVCTGKYGHGEIMLNNKSLYVKIIENILTK